MIFIGIHDPFSALIASRYSSNLFLSGLGLSASHYGLLDNGYISWETIIDNCERTSRVCKNSKLLVDIDDGFGSPDIAAVLAESLVKAGAFGIVMEDQQAPKICGHLPGKRLIKKMEYVERLKAVQTQKDKLYIVARTDASDYDDIVDRVAEYAMCMPNAILVDGLSDINLIKEIKNIIPSNVDTFINFMHGGKTKGVSASELRSLGFDNIIISAPCLMATIPAIDDYLSKLKEADWNIDTPYNCSNLSELNNILEKNKKHP